VPLDIDQDDQEVRGESSLRESGGSVVLTIPPDIARQAGFDAGDDVQVSTPFEGGEITLRERDDSDDKQTEASATN
jgi:antitoxin component of MazEF toxin-antitoxin module